MKRELLCQGWFAHWVASWIAIIATLGCVGSARAAALGDPTEAPPAWVATQPSSSSNAMIEAPPEMQIILTGKSRKLAVINGEIVKVGDEYKGSTVRAIKTNKVVMDDAEKSLSMTPDVKKSAPERVKSKKKSVVISADSVPAKANKEKQ